jgi:peptide/nickel transport system permease protein
MNALVMMGRRARSYPFLGLVNFRNSFGLIILALILALAVVGPMVSADPNRIAPADRLQFASMEHPFGTDGLGRDLFARIANGASVSLLVGLYVGLAATVIGLVLGIVAGYFKSVDGAIMRVMDGMMAIPPLLLAVALASMGEASFGMVIFALTVPEIPRIVRVARSEVLSLRTRLYIDAAVVSGSSAIKIMYRHILPNLIAPLSVQVTYVCAHAILAEAGLSFIGAGLPPNDPSWGVIVSENRSYFQSAPWTIFIPGFFLTITILAVSSLGDRLREKFGG